MHPGAVIELTIDDLAFGGDGVGRADGRVVFVPFVVPGERVRARVRSRKKQCYFAELQEILQPAPQRALPFCRYYQLCGGCQYQHVAYDAQLQFKSKQLHDILRRVGGLDEPLPIAPMLPAPRTTRYRNRIDLHPRPDGSYGFCERGRGRRIFRLHDCPLFALEQDLSAYPLRRPPHLLVVRTHDGAPYCYFKDDHNQVTSGAYDLTSQEARPGLRSSYTVAGRTYTAAYGGFFQVNDAILPALVACVRRAAAPQPTDTLLDVYCGVGLFALALAGDVARVMGVEQNADCILCAQANARRQGVTDAVFQAGTAEDVLAQLAADGTRVDVCLADPPRNGFTNKVVSALKRLRPSRLVYISCGPDTFARDARKLCDAGYHVRHIQPLDLFPHTKHFELVARFDDAAQV